MRIMNGGGQSQRSTMIRFMCMQCHEHQKQDKEKIIFPLRMDGWRGRLPPQQTFGEANRNP